MTHAPIRPHIDLSGRTHRELGTQRGELMKDSLARGFSQYMALFQAAGYTDQDVITEATASLEAVRAWRPERVEEIEAVAEASGLQIWQIMALNARTEILGAATGMSRECSTVAGNISGRELSIQTWDWHVELDEFWHTQRVNGPGHSYAGLTESGILSKIGMNSAGLGVHMNILGHHEDGASGIPIHVLSAVILEECASVDEAITLLHNAPIASSSTLTLIDANQSVSVELSPVGIFPIQKENGFLIRTNHFQDPTPAENEKTALYYDHSKARFDFLADRIQTSAPSSTRELISLMKSSEGEPQLCCVPDMSMKLGERWATLATVLLDPAERSIQILEGMPTDETSRFWRTFLI